MRYIVINKFSPIPLHVQLRTSIKQAIDHGLLKNMDKLPTEDELCKTFHISRPVVRQSYNDLTAMGYIRRLKGKGTFVSRQLISRNFTSELFHFSDEMARLGKVPQTTVLVVETLHADQTIASRLQVPETSNVLHFKRVRNADGIPVYVEDSYVALDQFPGLEHVDFAVNSLFHLFETTYHRPVFKTYNVYSAQVVGDADALLLDVPKRSAIHRVVSFTYDADNTVMEYSVASFAGERNTFDVAVRRDRKGR